MQVGSMLVEATQKVLDEEQPRAGGQAQVPLSLTHVRSSVKKAPRPLGVSWEQAFDEVSKTGALSGDGGLVAEVRLARHAALGCQHELEGLGRASVEVGTARARA